MRFCRWSNLLIAALLVLAGSGVSCSELRASGLDEDDSPMMKRLNKQPDPNEKSPYQGKTFDAGSGFSSKSFATGDYSGVKQYDSKTFTTKVFESAKKSWIGKMFFSGKKTADKYQETNSDATKQFASKNIAEKNYAEVDKKSSYAARDSFATPEFIAKGKAQGGIDNDQHIQEAVKKGLSEGEVRKLLNKPL